MSGFSDSGSMASKLAKRVVTRRQFVGLLLAGASGTMLAACGATPTPTPVPTATKAAAPAAATPTMAAKPTTAPAAAGTPKRGGTLIIGQQTDCQTYDPHRATGSANAYQLCYDTLVRWVVGPDGTCVAGPGLALSWTFDGNAAIFKLRQGVKFHDGSDFNAEVAKFNLERMNDAKSQARAFVSAIKSIDIVDPYTLKLNLSGPSGSLLSNLSQAADGRPYIISKAMAEKAGD